MPLDAVEKKPKTPPVTMFPSRSSIVMREPRLGPVKYLRRRVRWLQQRQQQVEEEVVGLDDGASCDRLITVKPCTQ